MILFFYVIKDFFKFVFGVLVLSTFLFILFDFIHKSTKYLSRYNPETSHLVSYYLYQVPNLFVQGLPISALLAGVICMVLLNRTNEITAMRAAGMGPVRIAMPIAVGGALLCLCSYLIGEFVLPKTAIRSHYIQNVLIEKNKDFQIAEGARWVRDGRVLLSFADYNREKKQILGVRIIQTGKSFKPRRTIEAKNASYIAEKDEWLLKEVKILYFWPNGTLSYSETRDSFSSSFPLEPDKLKKESRLPNEMSIRELREVIRQGEVSGSDVLHLEVDSAVKFAFHFASFVLSLIGIKFAYASERNMETARGILLAIGVGVSYWFILNAGRALGKRGTLHPYLAAWMANIIILVLGVFPLVRGRKV